MSHNIGESVVNAENMKTGNVVEVRENDGMVNIAYQDGVTEWVDQTQVKKLLIETDPSPPNYDGWQTLNEG